MLQATIGSEQRDRPLAAKASPSTPVARVGQPMVTGAWPDRRSDQAATAPTTTNISAAGHRQCVMSDHSGRYCTTIDGTPPDRNHRPDQDAPPASKRGTSLVTPSSRSRPNLGGHIIGFHQSCVAPLCRGHKHAKLYWWPLVRSYSCDKGNPAHKGRNERLVSIDNFHHLGIVQSGKWDLHAELGLARCYRRPDTRNSITSISSGMRSWHGERVDPLMTNVATPRQGADGLHVA